MTSFAERRIAGLTAQCKHLLRKRDRPGIDELIQGGARIVEYAGPRVQSEWQSFVDRTTAPGILTRMRNSKNQK